MPSPMRRNPEDPLTAIESQLLEDVRSLREDKTVLIEALRYWLPDETWMDDHYPLTDELCKRHWAVFYEHTDLLAKCKVTPTVKIAMPNPGFVSNEMHAAYTGGDGNRRELTALEGGLSARDLVEALVEILSQCHNLPASKTAERIAARIETLLAKQVKS